ncbi:MAG: type I restriction enzyme, S subunit [Candidatus Methanocomedens sp.]|nr:MAG: type I restriction enzyme, S subunit [ANME-2 cluster archaeon]
MQMMVEPFSVGPNVVPFISQNEIPQIYMYFLVANLVETKEYKRHWTELKNKKVVVAPKYYAKKFVNSMTSVFEYIDLLMKKNLNLRRTSDLLLPKLISGEVDVDNLEIETVGRET